MTKKEELKYLTELVLEASKWRLSDGDDRDTIRMEVEQRLSTLTGTKEKIVNGRIQSNQCPTETETEDEDGEHIPLHERLDTIVPFAKWKYYNRAKLKGLEDWQVRAMYNNEILQPTEEDYELAGVSLDDGFTEHDMMNDIKEEISECDGQHE